jgi:hypothetical protein
LLPGFIDPALLISRFQVREDADLKVQSQDRAPSKYQSVNESSQHFYRGHRI